MSGDCYKEITLEERINNGHLSNYRLQQSDDDMKLDNSPILHGNSRHQNSRSSDGQSWTIVFNYQNFLEFIKLIKLYFVAPFVFILIAVDLGKHYTRWPFFFSFLKWKSLFGLSLCFYH